MEFNHKTSNTRFRLLAAVVWNKLIATFVLSCLSTSIFKQQNGALAQQYIQSIKI